MTTLRSDSKWSTVVVRSAIVLAGTFMGIGASAAVACAATHTAPLQPTVGRVAPHGVMPSCGTNCAGRNFANADLSGLNLNGVNFSNANLSGANLSGSTLIGATLTGANLTNATLTNAQASAIIGTPQLSGDYFVQAGFIIGPNMVYSGVSLAGMNLSNFGSAHGRAGVNLTGASFINVNASGTNFSGPANAGVNLSGVSWQNCNLSSANFAEAWMVNETFDAQTTTTGTSFRNASMMNSTFSGTNLSGADLSGVVMSGVALSGVTMSNDTFSPTSQLAGATLTNVQSGLDAGAPQLPSAWVIAQGYLVGPSANLAGANLSGAYLTSANMEGDNLSGANLSNTTLTGADLIGATLNGANLANANLSNAKLGFATITNAQMSTTTLQGATTLNLQGVPASMPQGFVLLGGSMLGRGLNVSGMTLRSTAGLRGVDLTGANLSHAVFTGDDLTGTNFTNTDLSYATITQSAISANFSGANLYHLAAWGDTASNGITLPAAWQFTGGDLIGYGANLAGVDLSGLNLTNARLEWSVLTGANISGTNLTGVPLNNAVSGSLVSSPTTVLPSGAKVIGGYLVAPNVNLKYASFAPAKTSLVSASPGQTSNVTASSTTLVVTAATGFPQAGSYQVRVDNEIMTVSAGAGSTAWTVVRGANGTSASPHVLGAVVALVTGVDMRNLDLSGASLVGADLSYVDLSGVNLSNADLSGANLSFATVSGSTNLTGTTLSGADCQGVRFDGANLGGAVLGSANFTTASFAGTALGTLNLSTSTLTGVSSGGTSGSPQLPTGWRLLSGFLVGSSANFSGTNFTGADFSNMTGLSGINFTNANLSNVNFTNSSLTGFVLTGANLSGANLSGASLSGVSSGGITASPAPTLPAGWVLVNGYLVGAGANLSGAALSNTNLATLNMATTNFTGATLVGANLSGADLSRASMQNADLTGANLTGIVGRGVDVSNANFTNAVMSNASLLSATVSGACFTGATLNGLAAGNLTSSASPTLPTGWGLVNGWFVGPNANLTGATLTNANLNGLNMTGANFSGVVSGGVTGAPVLSRGVVIINGYLVGLGVNLSGANLSGVNFATVGLSNVTLTGANLNNASLASNDLTGVTSGSIAGSPVLPSSWKISNGYLIGPGVNLAGAQLGATDLTNMNLSGANLTNADLSQTTLNGVQSGSVIGTPLLPQGWIISNGYLIGRGANLSGANLVGENLNGLDLTGASFVNAQLNATTFVRAILTNVNFTNANLSPIPVSTTVSNQGAISAGQTSITVASASGFPTNASFVVTIDNENILVQGPTNGSTVWTILRGQFGSVAASHAPNATITLQSSGADFTGAVMTNTNFTNASLFRIVSAGITVNGNGPVLPSGWVLVPGGFLVGAGSNLSGQTMTGLSLQGVNLSGVYLIGTNLSNSNLSNANLSNAYLTSAILNGTNMSSTNLTNVVSGGVSGSPTLPGGTSLVLGYIVGPGANLQGANLQNASITNANLNNANLTNAVLDGITIANSSMLNVNFTNASIQAATLAGLDLSSANLSGANVSSSNLSQATLGGGTQLNGATTLANVNLFGANLTGCNLAAVGDPAHLNGLITGSITGQPSLPRGWWQTPSYGYLVGPNANLENANLQTMSLTAPNFANVDLRGANFYGSSLVNANFTNTDVTGTNFTAANLTSGNFSGSTMASVNFGSADLAGVTLPATVSRFYAVNVNFCSQNYSFNASSQAWTGSCSSTQYPATLPNGWSLYNNGPSSARTFLVGPGANLAFADLSNVDLSGTNLSGVSSGFLAACPSALPSGWSCASVGTQSGFTNNYQNSNDYWLLGPNADLSNQDWSNVSNASLANAAIQGADLSGSNFANTNFSGADLGTGANLFGTNLSSANLNGAAFHDLSNTQNATLPSGFRVVSRPGNRSNGPSNTLVGPFINLSNMDLSNWDLSNQNMTGVYVSGTNFSNTGVTNAILNRPAVAGGMTTTNLGWGSTTGNLFNTAPTTFMCPAGTVVAQLALGTSDGENATENFVFNCATVTASGALDVPNNDIPVNALYNNTNTNGGTINSFCGSGQAAFGIHVTLRNHLTNAGLACGDFPTESHAYNANSAWAANGGSNGYDTTAWSCPAGQFIVGFNLTLSYHGGQQGYSQAFPGQNNFLSVYALNQVVCQSWSQETWGATGVMSGTPQPIASPGWAYANGYMIGQGANLSGANLSNINLSDVNLTNANLTNTNLTNDNFSGVVSGAITGSPQLSNPYFMQNGFLVGSNVAFVGSNMSGMDFGGPAGNGRNLSGVTFVGNNISGVHFDNAYMPNAFFDASTYMDGAFFEGATLNSAVLSNHDLTRLGNLYGALLQNATLINDSIQGSSNLSANVNFSNVLIWNSRLYGDFTQGGKANFSNTNSGGNSFTNVHLPNPWNYSTAGWIR